MNWKNKILNFAVAGVLISIPLYPVDIVKCPDTLSAWMKHNFTYQAEEVNVDKWQTPIETRLKKTADCEDFAFYSQAVLRDLEYEEVKVIHIFGKKSKFHTNEEGEDTEYSHAICIFKKDGYWKYISNQYYISWVYFTNIEDLAKHVCSKWEWWRELQLSHRRLRKHYRKN